MVSAPSVRKKRREEQRAAALAARQLAGPRKLSPLARIAIGAGVVAAIVLLALGVRAWMVDPAARGHAYLNDGRFAEARVDLMTASDAAPRNKAVRVDLAKALNGLGRGAEAERQLRAAADLGADAALIRVDLAQALAAQGKLEAALQTLNAGAVPARDGARRMRMAADYHYRLGHFDEARSLYQRALRTDPNDPQGWLAFARYRLAEDDVGGADYAADQAWARAPGTAAVLAVKAHVVQARGGPVAALPWYAAALDRDPGNVELMLDQAAALGDAGRYRDMLVPLRRAAGISAGNPRALYLQAMLAARGGEYPLARSLLTRLPGGWQDLPAVLQLRAAVELALDTPDAARRSAARLMEQQPYNLTARQLLAMAQADEDNVRGAIETLDPITTRADADSWSLVLLARSFSAIDWQRDAAQPLDRAATLARGEAQAFASPAQGADSINPSAAVPAIRAKLVAGDVAGARALADRLLAANPGVPQAHLLAGDVAEAAGDNPRALAQFREAAGLRFDQPTMLRLVHALTVAGDRVGAVEAINQYLARWPEDATAMRVAAAYAADAGDWQRVQMLLTAAVDRVGPNDALLLAQLARAHLEQGDAASALAFAQRAYRLLPGNATTSGIYGIALTRLDQSPQDAADLLTKAVSLAPNDGLLRQWQAEQREQASRGK
mgnify:CR=1 FL=1